jgi:uncharacterized FlaG/YvyC family protein
MSEVTAVSKVALDLASKPVEMTGQENVRPAAAQAQTARPKEAVQAERTQPKEPAQPDKARVDLPLKAMTDVQLRYKVNPDTKELTVLVIDKSNHKVIRTIPSSELKNFKEGDLLELNY